MNEPPDDSAGKLRALAFAHYDGGRDAEARPLLEAWLAHCPEDAEAQFRLANLFKDAGELERAERYYREALRLRPGHARTHNNLGVVMELAGRVADARACYEAAVALESTLMPAQLNAGRMNEAAGRLAEAAENYRAAARLAPGEPQPHAQLGHVLEVLGPLEDAIASYRRVVELAPGSSAAYVDLGRALVLAGRAADAVAVYQQAIERGIDPDAFRHLVNAAAGATSARAPDAYVRGLFDGYAERFDGHLVQSLGYRVPAMLAERMAAFGDGALWEVLDLGCGTGLCGQHLRAHARRLVGVDLSPSMLRQAASKHVYDELIEAELTTYLDGARDACFDAVVAADVLAYLGELAPMFAGVRRVLRPHGLFAFSTESLDGTNRPFALRQSGRYAHAPSYLRALAAQWGFDELGFERAVTRTERRQPVQGDLVVLRRR